MLYCLLKGNRIQSCHFDDKLMKSGTLRLWVSVEWLILTVGKCVLVWEVALWKKLHYSPNMKRMLSNTEVRWSHQPQSGLRLELVQLWLQFWIKTQQNLKEIERFGVADRTKINFTTCCSILVGNMQTQPKSKVHLSFILKWDPLKSWVGPHGNVDPIAPASLKNPVCH